MTTEWSDQMIQELKASFDLFDEKQTGMHEPQLLIDRRTFPPHLTMQQNQASLTDQAFRT